MTILHITDYHFIFKNISKHELLVDQLISNIRSQGEIDLVIFTGDLVDKGGRNGKDFGIAYESLITKFVTDNIVPIERIFICCGNHDIDRGKEIEAIRTHLDKIISTDDLNDFATNQTRQFDLSLDNLSSYIGIQNRHYNNNEDIVKPLYTVHKRDVSGKIIGIVTLNSAWRSFDSDKDKGNLLFPTIYIEDAINHVKDCQIKILSIHHPLADLKDFNYYEAETLIYKHFQFIFSGHTHLEKIETHITGNEGIFSCVSPSTLTPSVSGTDGRVGYTIIEIDDDNFYEAIVRRYVFDKRNFSFFATDPVNVHIPLSEEKAEIIKIKTTVRRKLAQETETANHLILSNGESRNKKSFLDLFTAPALKAKSKAEITSTNDFVNNIDLSQLINKSNYVIYGKNKSGRTTILYKLLLDILKGFPTNGVLPLYIDSREFKEGVHKWDLANRLSRYYEQSKKKAVQLSQKYHIKLLIDNYNTTYEPFLAELLKSINNVNASIIICTDEITSRSYDSRQFIDFEHNSLYIHDISRKNIRNLVKKWPRNSNQTDEIVLTKINKVFTQLNIPSNYWTVSLFLWIFEKTNNVTLNNNFELIQLYVDELLDKTNLATDKNLKIKFDDLKIYLGELAFYLLNNFGNELYSASYADIISFTQMYRSANSRFVISVEDIVQLIINKSILKKSYNDRYSFRLNGIFEYFLAVYITEVDEYRGRLIQSNSYLSFSNELELYAGFRGKDRKFLQGILDRTKSIFSKINEKYGDSSSVDSTLLSKFESILGVSYSLHKIEHYGIELSALSPEDQDEMLDEMKPIYSTNEEIRLKINYPNLDSNTESLEKSLRILARVLKNSSVEDFDFNFRILDYIILCTCHLGFSILDEISNEESHKNYESNSNKNNKFKQLIELQAKFMPLIINTILVESLAQDNLERLILEKIQVLKEDNKNQFQLLLLYFLLIDLNPVKSTRYMNDLIDAISIGVLRQTILVKFYTYVVFFSYNNDRFTNELNKLIRKLRILIDPKSAKLISKELETLHKKSLVERLGA